MHAISLLSVLALAGSIAAAPVPEPEVVVVTKVATVIVTAGAEPTPVKAAAQTDAPQSNYRGGHRTRKPSATAVPVSTVVATKPASSVYSVLPTSVPAPSKPATTAAPPPSSAKPTTAAPAPSSAAPPSTGTDYLSIANKWRAKMGLPNYIKDAKLEANAAKTCDDGNGQLVHELNPGTMGQVLAPGNADNFEKVWVGGWLCEVPNTPGLDGICATMSSGWNYAGQTGHNKIIVDPKYTKLGCGLRKGVWGCDFA